MNLSNAYFELSPSQITSSLSITNMPPDFSLCNFIMNALHLASGAPNDPNILGHFLNHLTGHSYVRVDSTDGNVQRNEAQGQGSVADLYGAEDCLTSALQFIARTDHAVRDASFCKLQPRAWIIGFLRTDFAVDHQYFVIVFEHKIDDRTRERILRVGVNVHLDHTVLKRFLQLDRRRS